MNILLLVGAIFGLTSVMMAAFVDHALAATLAVKQLATITTALRYHQLYSIIISALALVSDTQVKKNMRRWLKTSGYIFALGMLIFSFGIYAAILLQLQSMLMLAPIGGCLLMLGWMVLVAAAL